MTFLACLALAQSVFTFSDPKNNLTIRANDGVGTMTSKGWEFDLKGNVALSSKSDRINLSASRVKATVLTSLGKNSQAGNSIDRATASGGVVIVQSASGQSSRLASNSAVYRAIGSKGQVDVTGSVRLQTIDGRKRQTLTATGSSGRALLNPTSSKGVESATLNGPVRVELLQSSDQVGKVVFTGNRLTLTGNQVMLTGNVKASGSGANRFGNLGNVDSIVANLNAKGEMTSFKFKSGGSK